MRSLFVLTAFVSTFIIGCGKEKSIDRTDPDGKTAAVNGSLKAKINGTQWVANQITGASRLAGFISIAGRSSDRKTFSIMLSDSGVHKYTITGDPFNAAVWIDSTEASPVPYTTSQTDDPAISGGEITITSIDEARKTMSGSFSVKVYRYDTEKTITISEGSFTDIAYITSLPATPATDSFKVKINGASWAPAMVMGIKVPMMDKIGITASDDQGVKAVALTFPSGITPGTYTLDFSGGTYIGQYNPDADPTHSKIATAGTLTILEHNTSTKRIRGSFAFTAAEILDPGNKAEITEGYFSVKYQ